MAPALSAGIATLSVARGHLPAGQAGGFIASLRAHEKRALFLIPGIHLEVVF